MRHQHEDESGSMGYGTIVVRDAASKRVKAVRHFRNLITDVGDEQHARHIGAVSPVAATGMRYGTGATAAAKSGAGAAIVTYVSGSARAFDSAASVANLGAGLGWNVVTVTTWPAGTGTATGIVEVVITNEAGPTDVAGTAANTIARAIVSSFDKAAGDEVEITYNRKQLGA